MIFVILIGTAWFVLNLERRRIRRNFGSVAYVTLIAFSIVMLYVVSAMAQHQKAAAEKVRSADLYRVVAHHQEKHNTP